MMKKIPGAGMFILFLVAIVLAQSKPLAVVNGETVTEDQVKNAAASDLENLELRKIQAEVGFQRDRQSIIERTLENIVEKKLIDAEANKRGITTASLLKTEVDNKLTTPSDKDVNAFYEANKSRISVSGDEALRQVRAYLMQRHREAVYQTFIDTLRKEHSVEMHLEPLRTPVATQGFPAKGPTTAPVTIVEFSDFECPYCSALFPTLKQIEAHYGDKIRIVFRQFPLTSIHPHAQKAAEASLCANEQHKFWELHDAMFQDNRNLDVDALKKKASDLKLDTKTFDACVDTSKYADSIEKDIHEGVRSGVTGTPAIFINGRFINGAQPYGEISKIIDDELRQKK